MIYTQRYHNVKNEKDTINNEHSTFFFLNKSFDILVKEIPIKKVFNDFEIT